MAADYVNLHIRIWRDPWFRALDPASKLLFIYLMSNDAEVGKTGIYEFNADIAGGELGDPFAAGRLEQFVTDGKVKIDRRWIWIVNFSHYQITTAKAFNSARAEARKLARRTKLANDWLNCYAEFGQDSRACSPQLGEIGEDACNSADLAKLPLTNSSNSLTNCFAAPDAASFLPLAEEVQALLSRLAGQGYPTDSLNQLTPETLASSLAKSGLPLPDIQACVEWLATGDTRESGYWRGELCYWRKWLNGGMWRRLQTARLRDVERVSLSQQRLVAPVESPRYPTQEEALAAQKPTWDGGEL